MATDVLEGLQVYFLRLLLPVFLFLSFGLCFQLARRCAAPCNNARYQRHKISKKTGMISNKPLPKTLSYMSNNCNQTINWHPDDIHTFSLAHAACVLAAAFAPASCHVSTPYSGAKGSKSAPAAFFCLRGFMRCMNSSSRRIGLDL